MVGQASLIKTIIDKSESNDYCEAINEWNLRWVDDRGGLESNCECGVRIRYKFHIENKKNENKLVLGSHCIKRLPNKEQNPDLDVDLKDCFKGSKLESKKINFGKYKGKSFKFIIDNDDNYSKWLMELDGCVLQRQDNRLNDFKKYYNYLKFQKKID